MLVEHLMTRDVAVCRPQDSLNEAARQMWEHDCGCVPIVDEQRKVVGIITDRDICMGALFHSTSLKDIPIATVMSTNVVHCGPNCHFSAAEQLMEQHQIRRLPVVDEDGVLEGIFSLNDLASGYKHDGRKIGAKEVANTIAAISAHRNGHNAALAQYSGI